MAGKTVRSARHSAWLFLLYGLTAAGAAGTAVATDWPSWRGPARNGVSAEEGWLTAWPASGPPRLWSAELGKSYATVSVQGKRVIGIGSAEGKESIWCLDAGSGAVRWRYSQAHPQREAPYDPNPTASTATPVIAGDRVYALTREGLALCLGADDGALHWQRDLVRETQNGLPPFGCGSSPVVEANLVLYNVGKHGVALDRQTGAVVWNSGAGIAGHASAVVYRTGDQPAVALFTGDGLVGVDLRTGRLRWRHPHTSANNLYAVDPVIEGDRIFITSYARGVQLRLADDMVTEVYETRSLRSSFNNPVLVGDHLYGSDRGTLKCIEWATGVEKWSAPGILRRPPGQEPEGDRGHPMGEGGLIAAANHLIMLDEGGTLRLVAATPAAYRELAHAKIMEGPCWTAPVLANGVLYCRNNDGALVALDLRPEKSER